MNPWELLRRKPGLGVWCWNWGLIRLIWRRCRPVPPSRRPTFFLEKVGKTAGSHIRPSAALRVPSLRCSTGATRPTTCFAKSTVRVLRLRRRVLRTCPFRTPPLGLLRSQVTGGDCKGGSSKLKSDSDRISLKSFCSRSRPSCTPVQTPQIATSGGRVEVPVGARCAAPFGVAEDAR